MVVDERRMRREHVVCGSLGDELFVLASVTFIVGNFEMFVMALILLVIFIFLMNYLRVTSSHTHLHSFI